MTLRVRGFGTLKAADSGDGRTLTFRAVPYGVVSVVRDDDGPPYREGFRLGAFNVAAPHRVPLIAGEHAARGKADADVGHGVSFREQADGLYADFRVDRSVFGDHTLEKVISGQWTHCSIGAYMRASETVDGVVWRTRAQLDHLLVTDKPQYAGAELVGVRESSTPLWDSWASKFAG